MSGHEGNETVHVLLLTLLAWLVGSLVVDRAAATLGIPLATGVVFAIALGVTFGQRVAVGAGLGAVLTDAFVGTFGIHSVFSYLGGVAPVAVAAVYWNTLGRRRQFTRTPAGRSARLLTAGVPAVTVGAATEAWGGELFGRRAFSTVFETAVIEGAIALVVVGVPFLFLVEWATDRTALVESRAIAGRYRFANAGVALFTALIIIAWAVGGTVIRTFLSPLQTGSFRAIVNRFGWTVAELVGLAGTGGRWVNVVLGTIAVLALVGVSLLGVTDASA